MIKSPNEVVKNDLKKQKQYWPSAPHPVTPCAASVCVSFNTVVEAVLVNMF